MDPTNTTNSMTRTGQPGPRELAILEGRAVRAELATNLLKGFIATDALALPNGQREAAVAAVKHLLFDVEDREHHVAHVTAQRQRLFLHEPLLAHSQELELPADMVVSSGLDVLTGEQIALLLVCPTTLATVGETLDELADTGSLPDAWDPESGQIARAMDAFNDLEVPPSLPDLMRAYEQHAEGRYEATDQSQAPPLDAEALELLRLAAWDMLPPEQTKMVDDNLRFKTWNDAALKFVQRRRQAEHNS